MNRFLTLFVVSSEGEQSSATENPPSRRELKRAWRGLITSEREVTEKVRCALPRTPSIKVSRHISHHCHKAPSAKRHASLLIFPFQRQGTKVKNPSGEGDKDILVGDSRLMLVRVWFPEVVQPRQTRMEALPERYSEVLMNRTGSNKVD